MKNYLKKYKLYIYNKKHHTQIESLSASLKPTYGKHVHIASGTRRTCRIGGIR